MTLSRPLFTSDKATWETPPDLFAQQEVLLRKAVFHVNMNFYGVDLGPAGAFEQDHTVLPGRIGK